MIVMIVIISINQSIKYLFIDKKDNLPVTGQNGILQNGTNKMVLIFIDFNSTELNFYLVTTSHK